MLADEQESGIAYDHKCEGEHTGCAVVQCFCVFENSDGGDFCFSRNGAAYHECHTEFPYGMGEYQCR